MEEFFYNQSPEPIFKWLDPEPPVLKQSAFEKYTNNADFGNKSRGNNKNVNKRMIEFLRRSSDKGAKSKEAEKERRYKHMMREKTRRENQRQSYLALHALLPPRTKNDKKTIVQVATSEIIKLKKYKEELERRTRELEAILEAKQRLKLETEAAKIKLRVSNPVSGIDSIVEVLKCLQTAGSTSRVIHSRFSDQELSAVLETGPEVEASELEKLVERTLLEVESRAISRSRHSSD